MYPHFIYMFILFLALVWIGLYLSNYKIDLKHMCGGGIKIEENVNETRIHGNFTE